MLLELFLDLSGGRIVEGALPAGLSLRSARTEDAAAICALMGEADLAEGFDPWITELDIRDDLMDPTLSLETDTWIVEDEGALVAYAELWNSNEQGAKAFEVQGWVAPGSRGRGLGAKLISWTEARALEAAQALSKSAIVHNYLSSRDVAARDMMRARGYVPVRYFFHMGIDLVDLAPVPELPTGLTLRSLDPERDPRPLHELIENAFRDHWGWVATPFEEFRRRAFERPDADPDLTPVIFDGDRLVAASFNGTKIGRGWVEDLAVDVNYRGRGLGELLLRESFRRFAAKGWRRAGLGVDVANPTGALRLYERVGMKREREFVAYEKLLPT